MEFLTDSRFSAPLCGRMHGKSERAIAPKPGNPNRPPWPKALRSLCLKNP